jgi:hypothetical protein
VFFIINIDARSQQLLYNTGRTALIVHNVQGVVLSFDFSCVSVYVDVLCFHHIQSCLVNSTYDISRGILLLLWVRYHFCQFESYVHNYNINTLKATPSQKKTKNNNNNKNRKKTKKNQCNVKDEKLKQYNPSQKLKQKCTPQKNHLSKKTKTKTKPKKKWKKTNNKQKCVTISVYHEIFRHCCF